MNLEQFKSWIDGYLAPFGGDASLLNKADFTRILHKLDMEVEQLRAIKSRGERYIEGPNGPEQPL